MLAEVASNGDVSVRGDPEHPANFGRLCSKGSALAETIGLEDRLLFPEVGGTKSDWDAALDRVAAKFSEAIREHGPDSVAFYVSGQLLTEDYYVANKLMKGFIGSANIDTNSRLCMASAVAGHKRAFGADTVPGCYEDLELADLVVLVGSNLAWCHPVLYQRIAAAKEKRPRMKIVLIDPRRTATADIADLHLPIKPDGDVALFLGLLALSRAQSLDQSQLRLGAYHGLQAGAARRGDARPRRRRAATGIRRGDAGAVLRDVRRNREDRHRLQPGRQPILLAAPTRSTPSSIAIWRRGASASRAWARSRSPASPTPWAAARSAASPMRSPRTWTSRIPSIATACGASGAPRRSRRKPGLKAVDMFRAVADGRIKALWIMATNPVVSMPEADMSRRRFAPARSSSSRM